MRIAQIDPLGYSTPYDDRLAAALAALGHEVHLLTAPFLLDRPPQPSGYVREELFIPLSGRLLARSPRARFRRLLKGAEYLPSVRRLLRRIEALDPDVVHVQWLPRPELDVRWLRRVAREHATVLTAHNALPRRSRAFEPWREALRTVGRVVVHSAPSVETLVGLGVAPARIVRMPHPAFDTPPGSRPEPPTGHVLLFFGLIRRHKGLDLLVSALPEIVQRVPDVRLVVAGDPLEPIAPVRQLATALGVDERIEWRLGYVPDAEVDSLFRRAAAVVLPYREIWNSGVLALAIGHGRPVVVSDVGAMGEIVGEFGAGRLVPPEDVEALASSCAELVTDPHALHAAWEGALAARAALTWEEAARSHERAYEALLDRVPESVPAS